MPGIQDRNSKPDIEFFKANFETSLSNAEVNEWKKIQGRYHDIIFQSNQKESIIFISEALASLAALSDSSPGPGWTPPGPASSA